MGTFSVPLNSASVEVHDSDCESLAIRTGSSLAGPSPIPLSRSRGPLDGRFNVRLNISIVHSGGRVVLKNRHRGRGRRPLLQVRRRGRRFGTR